MPTILDTSRSLLRDAHLSSSTVAGNLAQTQGTRWPQTNKIQIGDRIFLLDVIPRALDKRPISLSCESQDAIVCTIAVSPADPSDTSIPGPATRDHFALITFGTANGTHQIELDVCVGNAVSLPASTVQVEFFDETPRPSLDGVEPRVPYPRLIDSVNLSHFTRSGLGFRTRRVWLPYFLNAPINKATLALVVANVTEPGPIIRPIPPFATNATVVTASLPLTTTAALIFFGRNFTVVGLTLWGYASTFALFGAGRAQIPQAAEFFVVATNQPYPVAPAEGSDLFWVRFELEF